MIKIAVGLGENKNILEAIKEFEKLHDDCEFTVINNENELLKEIKNKETDAVIRGSLPSSNLMRLLKENNEIRRATYIKSKNYEFLLSPVGIDECKSINEKVKISIDCANFIKKLGLNPKIALLANGRKGDYGRSQEINDSIDESENLENILRKKTDYSIKNYYILIEKAIKDKNNIIIAPNGIIGNIIFRTLVLLDSWPSYGAIGFGLDSIFIDTSRDQSIDGYLRSIELAYKLSKN